VIAGPAEGWRYDETGRAVGDESGRPTLQLDDLVTVLRTFTDGGRQIFGCSIDPRPEGLRRSRSLPRRRRPAARSRRAPSDAGRSNSASNSVGRILPSTASPAIRASRGSSWKPTTA
jgi:hypothetical protein